MTTLPITMQCEASGMINQAQHNAKFLAVVIVQDPCVELVISAGKMHAKLEKLYARLFVVEQGFDQRQDPAEKRLSTEKASRYTRSASTFAPIERLPKIMMVATLLVVRRLMAGQSRRPIRPPTSCHELSEAVIRSSLGAQGGRDRFWTAVTITIANAEGRETGADRFPGR